VRVDFAAFRAYVKAVYEVTDEYRKDYIYTSYFMNGYNIIKHKFGYYNFSCYDFLVLILSIAVGTPMGL
jgi:hypothetical protein